MLAADPPEDARDIGYGTSAYLHQTGLGDLRDGHLLRLSHVNDDNAIRVIRPKYSSSENVRRDLQDYTSGQSGYGT
jgi:hypothetical protein